MVGQEWDTRKYRHLRNTDFYELKVAVQAEKRQPTNFAKCKGCGQPITGQDFDGYCLRCHDEPL
jgi:Zn finger protein HypA/HybF involved in hydrogenase expression